MFSPGKLIDSKNDTSSDSLDDLNNNLLANLTTGADLVDSTNDDVGSVKASTKVIKMVRMMIAKTSRGFDHFKTTVNNSGENVIFNTSPNEDVDASQSDIFAAEDHGNITHYERFTLPFRRTIAPRIHKKIGKYVASGGHRGGPGGGGPGGGGPGGGWMDGPTSIYLLFGIVFMILIVISMIVCFYVAKKAEERMEEEESRKCNRRHVRIRDERPEFTQLDFGGSIGFYLPPKGQIDHHHANYTTTV